MLQVSKGQEPAATRALSQLRESGEHVPAVTSKLSHACDTAVQAGLTWPEFAHMSGAAFLMRVMIECYGNKTHAAKKLDLHRNTIDRLLQRLELPTSRRWWYNFALDRKTEQR